MTSYVAAQLVASGKALSVTFGLDYVPAVLIGAAVILFYTMMGGFFAVAWTDVVQAIMMLIGLVVIPVVGTIKSRRPRGRLLEAGRMRGGHVGLHESQGWKGRYRPGDFHHRYAGDWPWLSRPAACASQVHGHQEAFACTQGRPHRGNMGRAWPSTGRCSSGSWPRFC